jgi:hypothetical protein
LRCIDADTRAAAFLGRTELVAVNILLAERVSVVPDDAERVTVLEVGATAQLAITNEALGRAA